MKKDQIDFPQVSAAHDRAIRRFTRKLLTILTLKYALILSAAWCFAWGVVALVLRVVAVTPDRPLLWGASGILLMVVTAIVIARRRVPPDSTIRALLDQQNECGGLLMAAGDIPLGSWQSRIPAIDLPSVRWRGARAWGVFALSIGFVLSCLLVPVRFAAVNDGHALDVRREVHELAEKIDVLKEEQFIAEAQAETLKQKLDQLGKEASGEDPVKTWEALDHLSEAVEKAAKEAAQAALAEQQKLAQAEALTESLMTGSEKMDPQLMTEAMRTLSEMMKSAAQENQMLARDLSPEIKEAIKSGALKPEQLKALAKALGQNSSSLNQKLSKLNQAGMVDAKSIGKGAQAGRPDNSGLAQFLKENAQRMSVKDAVAAWCDQPGKGGVSRGRADAAMTWTDGTSEKNAKFKEKELPPSAVAGLKDSELVGLSAAAPTVEKNVAGHGALNSAATGGGSAYTQTILPRHKGAVKRYFERTQK